MSLRAKVTGVTVAVLVIGLLAAGLGTMVFLRTTMMANLDETLRQLVRGPVTNALMDVTVDSGEVTFAPKERPPTTDYFLAVYNSDGVLVAQAGGSGDNTDTPQFPATVAFDNIYANQLSILEIDGSTGSTFHATAIVTQDVDNTNKLFLQMVALPTSTVERVVAAFLGIYTLLAVVTVVASAFLVRWVVTLTFRSLGQVERTADAIANGDFSQRMSDVEPGTTEVGRLKRAINTMLGRVDAAISQRDTTVRQMRRFIGDASHELRTPLVTVRGYAELYRMGAIPDAAATGQAMERIEKEAMRMTAMVEDLLALARLDERRDVVLTPLDLRPIARDAAMDLSAAAPQRDVTVIDETASALAGATVRQAPGLSPDRSPEVKETPATPPAPRRRGPVPTAAIGLASRLRRRPRGEPGDTGEVAPLPVAAETPRPVMPPVVMGDENRIRQVVANLLGNAQRFSAPDSPIELRVGTDEDARMGFIEVIDHGEGVPEQIRDQIFQRFWRADTSRARETGGSGLGLSIVASIVEALHGSVDVRDSAGGGATFRVAFPLAADQDAAAHALIETQPIQRLDLPRG